MEEEIVDTTKMMKLYSTLSENKLKETTLAAFKKQIEDDVKAVQEKADQIVNALTPGKDKGQPDFSIARGAIVVLVKSHPTIVKHWLPFVEAVNELLPPLAEGELVIPDADHEAKAAELRDLIERLVTPMKIASGAELREVDEMVSKLRAGLDAELEKRGLKGATPDAGPVIDGLKAEVDGLKAQLAAAQTERSAAQRTRDEMGQAADKLEEQLASETSLAEKNAEALKVAMAKLEEQEKLLAEGAEQLSKSTQANQGLKKQLGELEHEVEQLKKKSKSK